MAEQNLGRVKGEQGLQGAQGYQGATGSQGYQGNQGEVGGESPITLDTISTTTYTLALSNVDKLLIFNSSSAVTVTVPHSSNVAFAIGDTLSLLQLGSGTVTLSGATNVTLNSYNSGLSTPGQYSVLQIVKIAVDTWIVTGGI